MVDLRSVQAQSQRLGLDWQPGETANSSLSRLAARARTGAIPPGGKRVLNARVRTAARADHDGARAAAAALPQVVDWRRNGGNFVTPVKDQAFCGSCVAFGTIAVLESMVKIAAQSPTLTVDLSEAHLYFCYGPDRGALPCPDGGWWPDDSFACLKTGVVDEIGFPYTDVDQPCRLGPDATNRRTTASSVVVLDRVSDMKRHLATVGPLAACFTTYEDFTFFYRGGVYRYNEETSGEFVGGHCVAIVGYDDNQKCWIGKNSWGTEWGAGGYFRIGYGEVGIDASMWGITGTVKSPLLSSLHVVGAQASVVRHTTRTPKPAWTASTTVATPPTAGPIRKVSADGAGAALHVVGLADEGGETNLWHTLRKANGAVAGRVRQHPRRGREPDLLGGDLRRNRGQPACARRGRRGAAAHHPHRVRLAAQLHSAEDPRRRRDADRRRRRRGGGRLAPGRGDRRRAVAPAAQHVRLLVRLDQDHHAVRGGSVHRGQLRRVQRVPARRRRRRQG